MVQLLVNDQLIDDPKQILMEQKSFFQKLFAKNADVKAEKMHPNTSQKFLTDLENAMLNSPISMSEIQKTIKQMPNEKKPGPDGLPIEVYKIFWTKIKDVLFHALEYAIEHRRLHASAKFGIISLMPKKDVDTRVLDNWRPITLLNADYKIYAKWIANRLKQILPNIIDQDQTGYIKNRFIGSNIRRTLDIIDYVKIEQKPGLLVALDIQKAFDSLSWDCIKKAFAYFNISDEFFSLVQSALEGMRLCTINNGWTSPYFCPQRATKQGCPLSAYLFVISLEPFAQKIRQNDRIKGFLVNGVMHKLVQYADDLVLFLKFDQETLNELEKELDALYEWSGLRVNFNKSKIYRIGSILGTNVQLPTNKPFVWVHSLKILGIIIADENMETLNYDRLLQKVKTVCMDWSNRSLSLFGKIQIVNTLMSSQFMYVITMLRSIPNAVVKAYEKIVREFLWNGKKPKVKFKALTAHKVSGGASLVDIRQKDSAAKMQWISRMQNDLKVRSLALYFMPSVGKDLIHSNVQEADIKVIVRDSFWQDAWVAWAKFTFSWPRTKEAILEQFIPYNSWLRIQNKCQNWDCFARAGIRQLKDIFDSNANNWYTWDTFVSKYPQMSINFIAYASLCRIIPRQWLDEIKNIDDQDNSNEYQSS